MNSTSVQIGGVHFGGIPDLAELVPQGTQKGHGAWERATRGEKDVQREGRNGTSHPRGSFLGRLFRKSHHQKEKVEERASSNRVAEAPAEFLPIPCPPEPNELDKPVTSPRPEASGQEESRLLQERLRAAESHKGSGPTSPMFAFEAHVIESLTRKHRRPPLDLAALAAARREGTSGGAGARDTWRDPVREKDTCQESVGQSGKRDERDEGARVSGEAVAVEENPTEGSFGEGISDGVAEGFRDGNPAGSDGSRRGDSRGERSEAEHETGAEVRSGGAEGSSSRERLQDISALQAEGSVSRERLQDMSALQAVSGEGLEGSASHERVQGSVQPRSEDNNISDTLEGAGPREQSADLRQPDAEGGPREAEGSAAHERPQVAAELQTEAELESDRVRTGDWLSPTSKERATGRMKEFEYERQARAGREEGDRGHDAWQQEAGVSSVDDGAQEGEDGRRLSEGGAGPRTVVPAETDERSGSEKWISDSLEVVGMVREGSGYGVGHSRTKARVHVNGKVATGGIEWWPIGVGNGQTQQSGPAHSQRKDGKGRRNDWTGSDKSAGVAERGASNTIPVRDVQADHRT